MGNYLMGEYDIVVIGAGHAGCEAALASARLGNKTIIFSITTYFITYIISKRTEIGTKR